MYLTLLAWLLIGIAEALSGWPRGAPPEGMAAAVAAWGVIGALLGRAGRRFPALASPWLPPLLCVMGSALVKLELRGVALILAAEGALIGAAGGVWLLQRWPRIGLLLCLPGALAGMHMRGVRPVLMWPEAQAAGPQAGAERAAQAGRVVLLLTVDTLRADGGAEGLGGAWPEPGATGLVTYARIAAAGRSGPAISTAPWTVPAFGSVMTGLRPYRHGALVRPPVRGRAPLGELKAITLAERFSAAGWRTAAFLENAHISPDRGFSRGFGVWDHRDLRQPPRSLLLDPLRIGLDGRPLVAKGRDPEGIVARAAAWLASSEAPAFLWVHLLGPHLPYFHADLSDGTRLGDMLGAEGHSQLNVERIRRGNMRWTPELVAELRAAYRAEARINDAAIGRLLDAAPGAVVVYTSDHGEELADHGGWEHGHTLHEELLRVPLAIMGPGVPPGRWQRDASPIDIAPTLLALAGLPADPALPGVSLLAEPPERALYSVNTLYDADLESVRRGAWKLVRAVDGRGTRLVNLIDDPMERVDRCAEQAALCRELADLLDQEQAELADTPFGRTAEQIRLLGYSE